MAFTDIQRIINNVIEGGITVRTKSNNEKKIKNNFVFYSVV